MVTERVDEDLKAFARTHGYSSTGECLNELVLIALYGADALADVHRERIDALAHRSTATGTGKNGAGR